MTIIESGVISGIPTGGIIGGVICNSHGALGVIGGSLAGIVLGAVAGWLYGFIIIFLLSVVGVLWRAARKRDDSGPSEAEMDLMTPIAICGTLAGALTGLVCWFSLGWLYALFVALGVGLATACIAVGRCELRSAA